MYRNPKAVRRDHKNRAKAHARSKSAASHIRDLIMASGRGGANDPGSGGMKTTFNGRAIHHHKESERHRHKAERGRHHGVDQQTTASGGGGFALDSAKAAALVAGGLPSAKAVASPDSRPHASPLGKASGGRPAPHKGWRDSIVRGAFPAPHKGWRDSIIGPHGPAPRPGKPRPRKPVSRGPGYPVKGRRTYPGKPRPRKLLADPLTGPHGIGFGPQPGEFPRKAPGRGFDGGVGTGRPRKRLLRQPRKNPRANVGFPPRSRFPSDFVHSRARQQRPRKALNRYAAYLD